MVRELVPGVAWDAHTYTMHVQPKVVLAWMDLPLTPFNEEWVTDLLVGSLAHFAGGGRVEVSECWGIVGAYQRAAGRAGIQHAGG